MPPKTNVVDLPDDSRKTKVIEPRKLSQEFKDIYIVTVKGKEFVRYPGLVILAHAEGLRALKEEIIQFPCAENNFTVFAKAIAVDKDNNEWWGIGDANARNCSKDIASHAPRMAGTRAKARALRDLLGIEMASYEELNVFAQPEPMNSEQKFCCKELFRRKKLSKKQAQQIMFDITGCRRTSEMTFDDAVNYIIKLESLPDNNDSNDSENNNEENPGGDLSEEEEVY